MSKKCLKAKPKDPWLETHAPRSTNAEIAGNMPIILRFLLTKQGNTMLMTTSSKGH
jgi:hypothetical protein